MKKNLAFLFVVFLGINNSFGQRTFSTQDLQLDDNMGNTLLISYAGGVSGNFVFPPGGGSLPPKGTALGQTLWWNGSSYTADNFLTNLGNKLGIGRIPGPLVSRLDILDTVTGVGSNNFSINSKTFVNPSSASTHRYYGMNIESQATGTGSLSAFGAGTIGVVGRGTSNRTGANSVDEAFGVVGSSENYGSAGVNNAIGVSGQIVNFGGPMNTADAVSGLLFSTSNSIVNGNVFHATNPLSGVQNLTGVMIDQMTGGSATNNALLYNDPVNPFKIAGDGRVGIGTTSLFANGLSLLQTNTTGSFSPGTWGKYFLQPSGTITGNQFGLIYDITANNTGTMSGARLMGTLGEAISNRTGGSSIQKMTGAGGTVITSPSANAPIITAEGAHGEIVNQSASPITDARGVTGAIFNVGSGTIGNATSLYAYNPTNSGTINNTYGLYLEEMTAGTLTNTAILYNSASAPFTVTGAGRVGIGTTSPAAPLSVGSTSQLQVDGSGNLSTTGSLQSTRNLGGGLGFNPIPGGYYQDNAIVAWANNLGGIGGDNFGIGSYSIGVGGVYVLTLNSTYSVLNAVATISGSTPGFVTITSTTGNTVTVNTYDITGAPTLLPFNIIITGRP